jgi:hypothetical protein
MKSLTVKKTAAHYGGDWPDDDHVVLDGETVVGRIIMHAQASQDRPWLWSITSRIPQTPEDRGYAETRAQAIADLKRRWSS